MKYLWAILWMLPAFVKAQSGKDTTIEINHTRITLSEVIVRSDLNYRKILGYIQNDTTFYKAFRNLRVLQFSCLNNIQMYGKKGKLAASYQSKSSQIRKAGCRQTLFEDIQTTGDFFDAKGNYNYTTAEMYASLFFAKGTICGEDNIVAGKATSTSGKKGMDKHKEQLKMLFFNPGKKIPGIPLIGDKLDLYDAKARKRYDYRLDYEEMNGELVYKFSVLPKPDAEDTGEIVVDNMTTWFDYKTFEVLARSYSLSYKAGVYDFNVSMEVEMTRFNGLLVPKILRYKGNWDVIFKKRENGLFTATLYNFSE
jgi:hypothetical protein